MAKRPPKVEIISSFPLSTPRVRALLSLKLTTSVGDFVFHQCRVIEDAPGAPLWVSPPQEARKDGRHTTLCCWPHTIRKAVNETVRAHFQMTGGAQ